MCCLLGGFHAGILGEIFGEVKESDTVLLLTFTGEVKLMRSLLSADLCTNLIGSVEFCVAAVVDDDDDDDKGDEMVFLGCIFWWTRVELEHAEK